MKRILTVGALAIGLFLFVGTQAWATNLFTDPGFENGVNDWATVGYPFSATSSVVHSGTYAAKNTIVTVDTQEYYGQVYQIIQPFSAGDPVYMEGWVKTDFAQGSSARGGILVEFLRADDTVIDSIKTEMANVNNWFKIYTTGVAPAGTAKVRAGAFIYAARYDYAAIGGTVYVDDLFLDRTQAPGDLLTNPGFEAQLSGWTTGVGGSPFGSTTAETHSGTYSATDTVDTVTGQDYYGFIYQVKPFTAGNHLYASAWGKVNISPLAGAKGGMIVQFLNGSGNPVGTALQSEMGGIADWRQLYVDGIAPVGTVNVRVGAYLWAGQGDNNAVNGRFYIDDFVASTTPIPPPPPQTGLVDGGFENGVNEWKWQYRPFVTTNSVVHQGSFAAQHTIGNTTDPNNDYFAEVYQEFPFSQGQIGYITGWGKSAINPGYSAVGGVQISFYNGNQVLAVYKDEVGGMTDWRSLYAAGMAPTGTNKVRVSGYAWAARNQGTINGPVYLDDITFSNTAPTGLIFNPGFESDLAGWTMDATGFPMTATTLEHYSGNKSAKGTIQLPGGTADFWSRIYQEFAADPGQIIYATLWAKTNFPPASTGSAGLKIEFLNDLNQVLSGGGQDQIGGQRGWTYLYAVDAAPAGTTKVRISPFVSCPRATASLGGSAYFDDVVASHAPLPPPAFPTILNNTGFESGLTPWIDLYGLPTQIVADPHAGTYSAKKTIGVTPNDDYFSTTYQDIYYNAQGTPFPSAQNVYMTAYLKSAINAAANARVGIKIEYYDASDVAHEIAKDEISANNTWRKLYVAGTIPAGAKKVRVSGYAWALKDDPLAEGGTVNFDDFVYSYNYIAPPPLSTQLLNPGFENGINDWKAGGATPALVSTNVVHSGSYAAKFIVGSVLLNDYFGEIHQDIAVAPSYRATANIWMATDIDPAALAGAKLKIVFLDSSGQPLASYESQTMGGDHTWQQRQAAGTAPSGTVAVRVSLILSAPRSDFLSEGGIAYFDDVALTLTPPGGGGGGCFLAGTPITMADGTQKPIEEISVGDQVLAFDVETKQMKPDKVTEIFKHDQEDMFLIVNGHMKVTPIHRVLSKGNWIEIGKLKVGDTLTNTKGEGVAIQTIEIVKQKVDIYNFEVNPYHTYVAGGFIVHNKKMVPVVWEPPCPGCL